MCFLSIFVSLLLGFLSCLLIFKEKGSTNSPASFIKVGRPINFRVLFNLSFPIGMGISSVIFIFLNLLGLTTSFIFLIEIGMLIFLFFKIKNFSKINYQFDWFRLNKHSLPKKTSHLGVLLQNPILLLITGIYIYAWLMDAGIFLFDSVQNPHGLWDAWANWNLLAKFISRDPHGWANLFHQIIPDDLHDLHIDYPLLQKGFIARCWILAKTETVWVPIIFCFIITFCTIGLLASSVRFFTNKTNGLIAGLILLCTPFYMTMGDSQYADNTVGYFYLATIVLMTFARSGTSIQPRLLMMAGITAGLSAWSKNEGLFFIVCLFASQLPLLFIKNYRELLVELKYLFLGMLPILILIAYYKIKIAPPNDIMADAQGSQVFAKLTDFSRYELESKWYIDLFKSFGKWAINPWWLFLFGILYKGVSLKKNRNSIISNFMLILLMLTGFFFIFIISHLDLNYYLSSTLHRLFFQLFPSFIFIYFLAIKSTPENKAELFN